MAQADQRSDAVRAALADIISHLPAGDCRFRVKRMGTSTAAQLEGMDGGFLCATSHSMLLALVTRGLVEDLCDCYAVTDAGLEAVS